MPRRTTLTVVAVVVVAAAAGLVALAGGGGTGLVPEAGTGQVEQVRLGRRRGARGPAPAPARPSPAGPSTTRRSTWPACAAGPWC